MDNILRAIDIVKKGGIIIYPTDTAYGIGCKVSDEKALERLFRIRKRAETKAVPVLVDTIQMGAQYVGTIEQEVIDRLMEPYWPGALTIVLPCIIQNVPKLVRGGGKTIGLRIPNHPLTRALISGVGEGIVGCSANFAGMDTPFVFTQIDTDLLYLVDYCLEGTTNGKLVTSTVIDCSVKPWKILREGAIKI